MPEANHSCCYNRLATACSYKTQDRYGVTVTHGHSVTVIWKWTNEIFHNFKNARLAILACRAYARSTTSVCLSVQKVYCGKMADWIRMPFAEVTDRVNVRQTDINIIWHTIPYTALAVSRNKKREPI